MPDKAHAARLRKMRFAIRHAERHLPRGLPALFALTDPVRTPNPVGYARGLPCGTGLIYRHFGAPERYETARALAKTAREAKLVLLIANDPLLARQVSAHGVHWPEANMSRARRWHGAFEIMTGAAHSRTGVGNAAHIGLDATLFSTVFPSASPSAGRPIGAQRFTRLCQRAPLPVYALGGLNAENMGNIARSGGIAGIGALRSG